VFTGTLHVSLCSDKFHQNFPLFVAKIRTNHILVDIPAQYDRLCGLVVRVLGYRSGGPGSIPGTTRFSGQKEGKK
jgi:hypothetical protein